MSPTSATSRVVPAPTLPDLSAVKTRQQALGPPATTPSSARRCRSSARRCARRLTCGPDQRVLDVAAGNGNATLAAARRWCDVVSTDYVPALLERGRERAAAERLAIEFREADAEALPFADASFDVVLSTFGVMFTPDQDRPPPSCCASASPAARSAWRTGRRTASSASCSRPSASTCRRRRASSRRRSGAPARASPNCSAPRPPRSSSSNATSCFVTDRRTIGSTYSRPTTARS